MSYVFLSYSREDLESAARLKQLLADEGIDVFWDQDLLFGEDFRVIIQDRLEGAACVLVLWCKSSVNSDWVPKEAEEGRKRRTLIEVRVEDCTPPLPFPVNHAADMTQWAQGKGDANIRRLLTSVTKRVSAKTPPEADMSLAAPRRNQDVTDAHLALIHVCWRSRRHDKIFPSCEMYRWDVCLYGSKQALNRVDKVTYFLHPAYDYPDDDPPSFAVNHLEGKEHRQSCFLLKQLANGHSLVRAHIKIKRQPELVKLSRYINLFQTKDKISDYFV